MRTSKVVELLPLIQFLVQIYIVRVTQQLIELFLVGAMGSLDLTVELRRSRFDIRMSDTQVFDVPMELRLELMATIGSDLLDSKRKLGNDVVNKSNRILLRMAIVNFERSYARCIVDGGVLVSFDPLARFAFEYQELNVHLDVVARYLLVVAFPMHLSTPHLAR